MNKIDDAYHGNANDPRYIVWGKIKCVKLLEELKSCVTSNPTNQIERLQNIIELIDQTLSNLQELESKKIRNISIKSIGFEKRYSFLGNKIIGINIKISGFNNEETEVPTAPVLLKEFDSLELNLYSGYNPIRMEKK